MRIGFLFNHDQIHQIAHSLPIAIELAKRSTGVEVVLATTNERITTEVTRLAEQSIGNSLELRELRLARSSSKILASFAGGVVPASKLLVYRDNLDFFRSLDVLVVAEKTSLILKTRYKLEHLKIVHTRHGAGDRAIGFNKASAKFDHVLVSGAKVRDRLISDARVAPERITVVGYPKFDLFANERWQQHFPNSQLPIVVYNPHVSPHLSSWFKVGLQVLDWFVDHPEYNLVFAPHVMLFERAFVVTIDKLRISRTGRIPQRIRHAKNIHVDLGSNLSTSMAYLNSADIYLGDVSSQVYEFLLHPRACVFLNPHGFAWGGDPNFAFWAAGPVIERVEDLGHALEEAVTEHATRYTPVQESLVEATFHLTDAPSSVRAALAVATVAGLSFSGD